MQIEGKKNKEILEIERKEDEEIISKFQN